MENFTLNGFYTALELISPFIIKTPLQKSNKSNLFLKWENQQVTGSFKARGAFFKILHTDPKILTNGVIAASAGNHGQGVALAASKINTPAAIYTYAGAPEIKINAMKNYGAEVIVVDGTYRDAEVLAQKTALKNGCLFISPYNDEQIIRGQGTIVLEVLDQLQSKYQIENLSGSVWYVPVSGGGLLAGIASTVRMIDPDASIIGVQPENSAFMHGIFYQGSQDQVVGSDTIADSLDGAIDDTSITIPIIKEAVDTIQLVSEGDMMEAIARAWHDYGQKIEASGAVSFAAALQNMEPKRPTIAIISGGNIQVELFNTIINTYD